MCVLYIFNNYKIIISRHIFSFSQKIAIFHESDIIFEKF